MSQLFAGLGSSVHADTAVAIAQAAFMITKASKAAQDRARRAFTEGRIS